MVDFLPGLALNMFFVNKNEFSIVLITTENSPV